VDSLRSSVRRMSSPVILEYRVPDGPSRQDDGWVKLASSAAAGDPRWSTSLLTRMLRFRRSSLRGFGIAYVPTARPGSQAISLPAPPMQADSHRLAAPGLTPATAAAWGLMPVGWWFLALLALVVRGPAPGPAGRSDAMARPANRWSGDPQRFVSARAYQRTPDALWPERGRLCHRRSRLRGAAVRSQSSHLHVRLEMLLAGQARDAEEAADRAGARSGTCATRVVSAAIAATRGRRRSARADPGRSSTRSRRRRRPPGRSALLASGGRPRRKRPLGAERG
jgi:hypothetical protein